VDVTASMGLTTVHTGGAIESAGLSKLVRRGSSDDPIGRIIKTIGHIIKRVRRKSDDPIGHIIKRVRRKAARGKAETDQDRDALYDKVGIKIMNVRGTWPLSERDLKRIDDAIAEGRAQFQERQGSTKDPVGE
jgi:hypothetical protein